MKTTTKRDSGLSGFDRGATRLAADPEAGPRFGGSRLEAAFASRRHIGLPLLGVGLLWVSLAQSLRAAPATGPTQAVPESGAAASPTLRIAVDPRVELVSLIFRLAGNPEYNQGRVASYTADVKKQFEPFADHAVVRLARQLRSDRGVSYDACMSLAVLLSDAQQPRLKTSLQPWPESLDQRWTAESADKFVALAREFVRESGFKDFLAGHQPLYETTDSRLRDLANKECHLEWFGQFFGRRPQASFTLTPALLNGGCCYGPHARDAAGKEELFCILGVWETDSQGLPSFRREMLSTLVHEFCHSYVNAIADVQAKELEGALKKLYDPVAKAMRSQAYGNPLTMLRESLVRACVVRYIRHYDGESAANRAIQGEIDRSFLWMKELSGLLGEYEAQRDRYPTFESFGPRLVTFFNEYSVGFAAKQKDQAARRPKVVSMTPANGATDVDPAITVYRVTFDRPMRDGGWAMCGSGPHYPDTPGKASYDAARTTWTIPLKLKPEWDYEFWLNAGRYNSFQSADGVPLESVRVTFRTGRGQ